MKALDIFCLCVFLLSAILTIVAQTSTVYAQSTGWFCAAIWVVLYMKKK